MNIRNDWSKKEVLDLLSQPFNDLIFLAQQTHRRYFDPNEIQLSTLLNIKSGKCPEDCKYCPQSARYKTDINPSPLLEVQIVVKEAQQAKTRGASRFCIGAAWRQPSEKDLQLVMDMIEQIKQLGMETCATLGLLNLSQARRLKESGLDYYNHNLDTSPEYYSQIINTRTYQDRLDTLKYIRDVGINVCSGGIIGMGENQADRAGLLIALANLPKHPESVPINMLVQVEGTPLANAEPLDPLDFIRIIACARIMMPKSYVRLSAGREQMSEAVQALCFIAGANSVFYGEKLLTTKNPQHEKDRRLFHSLGVNTVAH